MIQKESLITSEDRSKSLLQSKKKNQNRNRNQELDQGCRKDQYLGVVDIQSSQNRGILQLQNQIQNHLQN